MYLLSSYIISVQQIYIVAASPFLMKDLEPPDLTLIYFIHLLVYIYYSFACIYTYVPICISCVYMFHLAYGLSHEVAISSLYIGKITLIQLGGVIPHVYSLVYSLVFICIGVK